MDGRSGATDLRQQQVSPTQKRHTHWYPEALLYFYGWGSLLAVRDPAASWPQGHQLAWDQGVSALSSGLGDIGSSTSPLMIWLAVT